MIEREGVLGRTALVIGGGIGGLTAAIALRQRGIGVEMIERDPAWSVYGVGIIQQSNVVRAVAALGVLDGYLGAGFGFECVRMFAPDGTQIATIPSPRLAEGNYPANVGIRRRALQRVLADRAESLGARIRLGVTATALHDTGSTVDVQFSDGTAGSYPIVVGADGLFSATRLMLFPNSPKPRYTGQAVWRYNLPKPADLASLDVYAGRVGIGLVPLSQALMYIFVTTPEPDDVHLPVKGLAAEMRSRLKDAPPRIAALASQITDDEAVVYKPLETLFVDGDWHKGRIVLLGDAVHAATPHLGQGAGMAIEDSLVLAEELDRNWTAPEKAFAAYHERRFERCRFVVEGSAAVGDFQMGRRAELDYPGLTRKMFEVTAAPL